MSEQQHPGLHPDPDSLNAFIEGVLPEYERLQCLAHLAECQSCRQVVFLAQEAPRHVAVSNPIAAWRRWFSPVPVFAAAAAMFLAAVTIALYLHYRAGSPSREVVARTTLVPLASRPLSAPEVIPPTPKTASKSQPSSKPVAPPPRRLAKFSRGTAQPPPATFPPTLPAPPQIASSPGTIQNPQLPFTAAPLPSIPPPPRPPSDQAATEILSGISGTVTDPTGAAVPGADIKLRQLAGTVTGDARSDRTGQFRLTDLPPGSYELQISAPGFRHVSRKIDLQPQEVATLRSQLEVGAATETVTVTAASPSIQTSSSTAGGRPNRQPISQPEPRPLPSVLPAITTVASGKMTLAVDANGSLFLSRNGGKNWKAIKPVWSGKVVRLITPAEIRQSPIAVFQLTTDSGSSWLSRDGSHWYPAPSQH